MFPPIAKLHFAVYNPHIQPFREGLSKKNKKTKKKKKGSKAHLTTPKGIVGSFLVTFLDDRISGKSGKTSL